MSGGRSSPWPNGQSGPGPQNNNGNTGGGGSLGPFPPNDTRTRASRRPLSVSTCVTHTSWPTRAELYVGNLPFRVRWQDLKDLFRKCGTVLRADVALTPHDGRSRGFGVVLFARYLSASYPPLPSRSRSTSLRSAEDAYSAIEKYNGFSCASPASCSGSNTGSIEGVS